MPQNLDWSLSKYLNFFIFLSKIKTPLDPELLVGLIITFLEGYSNLDKYFFSSLSELIF